MEDKMAGTVASGLGLLLAGAALAVPSSAQAESSKLEGPFPIVELRQYTLHDGRRDELINLFEREFVESQEAQGMKVIGTFTDLDRPNRFVWLRGFHDMNSRLAGLSGFYDGPLWKAHRDAANATIDDSDNVLLLHASSGSAEFALPDSRPALGEQAPSGLVVATIYYLKAPSADALAAFEKNVVPALEKRGIHPLAWFTPEPSPNNFRLPVREGENVLVWFAAFAGPEDHSAHRSALKSAEAQMKPLLARDPEVLRLKPTSRSLLRGLPAAGGVHDFDFLHGRWKVHHRLLKARGVGSHEWTEYDGTAETRPLLGGLCNVEEHRITGRSSGVALRCYEKTAKRWAIYWVGDADGLLGAPVYGGFDGADGQFEGRDVEGGRPIVARFHWQKISPGSARWEQSYSYDNGKSWEKNWIMDFTRSN